MRFVIVVACAGCGRIAFDELASAPSDGGGDGSDAGRLIAGCEPVTFESLPLDTDRFGDGTVEVANGRLRMAIQGFDGQEVGIQLTTPISFAGRSTVFEVVTVADAMGASTLMGWHQTTGAAIGMHLERRNGRLLLVSQNGDGTGFTEHTNVAFDPVAHAWWRFHERAGGLDVETSSDGVDFALLTRVDPFDTSAMRWDVGIGAYSGATGPIEAAFDNLADCTP